MEDCEVCGGETQKQNLTKCLTCNEKTCPECKYKLCGIYDCIFKGKICEICLKVCKCCKRTICKSCSVKCDKCFVIVCEDCKCDYNYLSLCNKCINDFFCK